MLVSHAVVDMLIPTSWLLQPRELEKTRVLHIHPKLSNTRGVVVFVLVEFDGFLEISVWTRTGHFDHGDGSRWVSQNTKLFC